MNTAYRTTEYLQLQDTKPTVRIKKVITTSQGNITIITNRSQHYVRELFKLVEVQIGSDG